MFSPPNDDDEEDFIPSSSSKLSSLFGGSTGSKSPSLKYVAPKQPRPERSDSASSGGGKSSSSSPAPQAQQAKSQTPAVLIAAQVHAYLFVNGVAQSQGRVMCCILGSSAEKNFQLLLYRSKQDHLTRARIHHQFNFTIQANNYASFSDDQQRSWSVMIDAGPYAELVTQIGVCRALAAQTAGKTHVTQDVTVGEGPVLQEGDQAQISFSRWTVINGKKGSQAEEMKSAHRVKLKEMSGGWERGLLGAQKNTRRLIFDTENQDKNTILMYDVSVERLKQKGSDHSGRSTPQVDIHQVHREENNTSALDKLPEDNGSNSKEEHSTTSKASLVSRMARMGHSLLPSRPGNFHTPPTDSESEVEEITRKKNAKYNNSGSISGSMEELEATPAVRARSLSSRSDASKPEPAPRPANLSSQQHLVVYQSAPWQQPGIMHAAYPGGTYGAGPQVASIPQPVAPSAPDPTLSLLFSESRSQNTDLKVTLSKMSDQLDKISNKLEKVEQDVQHGGQFPNMVASSRMMVPQHSQAFTSPVSCDPHALLTQITTMVKENDDMKAKLQEKDEKIGSLNESLTQLLQKNQKLLEEKADMLVVRNEQNQQTGHTVSITEVINLKEEKASLAAQCTMAQQQLSSLREELNQAKIGNESQQQEISNLTIEIRQERNKNQELQTVIQNQKADESKYLEEQLQNAQKENESIKNLLRAAEASKQSLEEQLDAVTNKQTTEEEQRKVTEVDQGRLRNLQEDTEQKLQTALQQIAELEKERLHWKNSCSQLEKEKSENTDSQEFKDTIEKLQNEKELLEKTVEQLRNTNFVGGSSLELIAAVKKVMNTVFKTLKTQFREEESYLGSAVMEKLLSVIRDTTLQLLADLEEKNSSTKDASASPQDNIGNNIKESNEISNTSAKAVECSYNNTVNRVVKQDEGDNSPKTESKENSVIESHQPVIDADNCDSLLEEDVTASNVELPGEGECVDQELLDPELDLSGINTECDSDDRTLATELPPSLPESSDDLKSNYHTDNEQSSSIGSRLEERESSNDICDEEADTLPEDKNEKQRIPVIDMENTEARTLPTEKSDSSRDSSLERAWKPQPPPPPLFSDEDDDDDWLS